MDTVSILIPVYNAAPYLSKCLDSVIHQTYPQLEIILADDGSTDESGAICDAYAAADPRIRVLHNSNEGAFRTRRTLFTHSTGKYILYPDSDDWIEPDTVETALALAKKAGAQIVCFGRDRVCNDGSTLSEMQPYAKDGAFFSGRDMDIPRKSLALDGALNSLGDKLIERRLLSQEEKDDAAFPLVVMEEDKLQLLSVFRRADSFAYCAKCLYHYRCTDLSVTQMYRPRYFRDTLAVMEETERFLSACHLDTDKNITTLHRNRLFLTIKNCYTLVHCGKYSMKECVECFRDLKEHPLIAASGNTLIDERWNAADKYVLHLLRRRQWLLVCFLRFEGACMNLIRKGKEQ